MEQPPVRQAERLSTPRDRILVAGGSARTIDFLRLATIRSDDVVLFDPTEDVAARRFAQRFAIEVHARSARSDDLADADVVLVAMGDIDAENVLIRAARRMGIPVHVADRELVSDFRLLAFLEQRPSAALAA